MMRRLIDGLHRFGSDARGQVAIIFGLTSVLMMVSVGAGVDLARAYQARQKLSHAATLACQYSNRDSVEQTANSTFSGSAGFQTYVSAVNAYATTSLASQNWGLAPPTGPTGTAGAYFTATPAAGGASTLPTNASVTMAAIMPTAMMHLIGVDTIPVRASVNCAQPQQAAQNQSPTEGFETPCTFVCYTLPNGTVQNGWGAAINISSGATYNPGFKGNYGTQWTIIGYCLEVDATTSGINSQIPEGTHTAELDCDNGVGSAGNSSITTRTYLQTGVYELRYNYRSRVDYPNYDPAYICGSTAADVSWANDTFITPIKVNYGSTTVYSAYRSNQINVYLDMATSSTIPVHTTLDGTEQLGGSNLIDMCVYSPTWVERSVRITVQTPAYYYLSFAADGQNDSFGGQLDNIRLCPDKCVGSPQDNFPPTWLAANNGGVNTLLFEDSFETPVYAEDPYITSQHNKGGNLGNSYGTTVSGSNCSSNGTPPSYPSPPGWPCQQATGWSVAPYNEVVMDIAGAYKGNQYVAMDGNNSFSSGADPSNKNRLISKPFLLDPGYYNVSYDYVSNVDFTSAGYTGLYCFAAPQSGAIFPQYYSPLTGALRYSGTTATDGSTNIVGVYMSNGALVSTPVVNTNLGAATTFTNPDGTTSTTPALPTVPPDNVTWWNYNASVNNPVIDVCGYSSGYTWVPRNVNVKITKPGFYWLTFSANGGTADGNGGGIDDVKLTALGSLYMSNAPQSVQVAPSLITTTPPTTIPVPDPQPDSTYTNSGQFNGFTIVADPKTPTGGP